MVRALFDSTVIPLALLVNYTYYEDETPLTCNKFAYDAFGSRLDPLKDMFTGGIFYTGQQWDGNLKMYNLRARYYDPLTDRFNQTDHYSGNNSDPISLHKYLYGHGNPVNRIDPSGNMTLTEVSIVCGIFATAAMIVVPTLHHVSERSEQILNSYERTDAVSFLSSGLREEMNRDIAETKDPDMLGMHLSFWHDWWNE